MMTFELLDMTIYTSGPIPLWPPGARGKLTSSSSAGGGGISLLFLTLRFSARILPAFVFAFLPMDDGWYEVLPTVTIVLCLLDAPPGWMGTKNRRCGRTLLSPITSHSRSHESAVEYFSIDLTSSWDETSQCTTRCRVELGLGEQNQSCIAIVVRLA
jgi:hypothetical protein